MQRGFSGVLLIFVVLLLAAGGFGGYYLYNQQKLNSINSFEECAKHFPVMESYPEQCNTSDGRHFVRQVIEQKMEIINEPQKKELTKTQPINTDSGFKSNFNLPNLFLGPKWESTVSARLNFIADPGLGAESIDLDGFRVRGMVEEKLRYASTDEFIEYYESELAKLGWDIEKSSWADGIDGHSRSYRKGNVYLTIGYRGELEDPEGLRFGNESQKIKGTIFTVEYAMKY